MEGNGQQFKIGGAQSFSDHNGVAVPLVYVQTHASAGGFVGVSRTPNPLICMSLSLSASFSQVSLMFYFTNKNNLKKFYELKICKRDFILYHIGPIDFAIYQNNQIDCCC